MEYRPIDSEIWDFTSYVSALLFKFRGFTRCFSSKSRLNRSVLLRQNC